MISGTGFAIGKTTAPAFIERTISWETICGALTPIKTSASFIASASVPCRSHFVISKILCWPLVNVLWMFKIPALSTNNTSPKCISNNSFAMAQPALPAPLITIRTLPIGLFTTFNAFNSALATTMAVPC